MTAAVPVEVLLDVRPTKLRQLHRHTGDGEIGDCFRTAIACLLGYLDPSYVPHFVRETITLGLDEHGGWEDIAAARRWARATEGLDLALIDRDEADRLGVAAQAVVRSKAGPWNHSVIYHRGEVVWCPSTGDADTWHPGDYTVDDLFSEVPVLVVCLPYDPDPDRMLAEWRARAAQEAAV